MTKAELIDKIAGGKLSMDVTKKVVGEIIDATFDQIGKTVKKEKRFTYPGFGTWSVRRRKARKGRNPQTGEPLKIKARNAVTFKAGKKLKDAV